MKILKEADEFLSAKMTHMSTSDRVAASREAKRLILAINEIYKESDDDDKDSGSGDKTALMDLMKELTVKKKRIDVRLKGRPDSGI